MGGIFTVFVVLISCGINNVFKFIRIALCQIAFFLSPPLIVSMFEFHLALKAFCSE